MQQISQIPIKQQIHFMWTFLKPHKWPLIIGAILVLISTALDQISPWMVKNIIDDLNTNAPRENIYRSLAILLAATFVSAIMLFWQRRLVISASRRAEFELRNNLFKDIQEQNRLFFDQNPVADIMSRSTSDLDHVRDLIGPVILHLSRMALLFIYTAICLWWISPWMALVGIGMAVLLPIVTSRFMKRVYKLHSSNQSRLSALNGFVREVFSGISVVKSYGKETQFQKEFNQRSVDFRDTSMSVAKNNAMIWPIVSMIGGLGLCISLLLGSWLVTKQTLTIGALSAAILYLVKVQFPLVGLGWVLSTIQRGRASLDRIMNLQEQMTHNNHNSSQTSLNKEDFKQLELINCNLELSQKTLLSNINLKITKGQSLGIVGETGSGKTLLTHILSGTYACAGQVKLNNETIQNGLRSHKNLYSSAPQDGFLFSESIRFNIEIAANQQNQQDQLAQIERVVKLSCLEQDLEQIPNGLDAMLGERGINLSGGQKQRVGLARALIRSAPILILDDVLSALDTETESKIIQNLKEIKNTHALILVAHRYSAIVDCEEIIFLKNGQIHERGTHRELIDLQGEYSKNWTIQQVSHELGVD
jgi:ATP-binding cassette subfamily B multidrug efflux pump